MSPTDEHFDEETFFDYYSFVELEGIDCYSEEAKKYWNIENIVTCFYEEKKDDKKCLIRIGKFFSVICNIESDVIYALKKKIYKILKIIKRQNFLILKNMMKVVLIYLNTILVKKLKNILLKL